MKKVCPIRVRSVVEAVYTVAWIVVWVVDEVDELVVVVVARRLNFLL